MKDTNLKNINSFGTLFIVSTPIGNLSDITLRALETLKNVDIIACEDTRTSKNLLDKYEIKTRLISYHKYSENARSELILNYLKEGKNVALITDAGTPLISDPGNILVNEVSNNGFKIVPIVGACALISLLQSVQREGESFKFIGFLPKSEKQIAEIFEKNSQENLIFYESPKRILKTLEIIKMNGDLNAIISIGREMTKKFEEIITTDIKKAYEHYKNKSEIKGEFVCMFHKTSSKEDKILKNIEKDVKMLKNLGISGKNTVKILTKLKNYKRNDIYKIAQK